MYLAPWLHQIERRQGHAVTLDMEGLSKANACCWIQKNAFSLTKGWGAPGRVLEIAKQLVQVPRVEAFGPMIGLKGAGVVLGVDDDPSVWATQEAAMQRWTYHAICSGGVPGCSVSKHFMRKSEKFWRRAADKIAGLIFIRPAPFPN